MSGSEEPKRVLVVDDERIIAETLKKIFELRGYQAEAVFSAEEALALMPEWIPDYAFVDVHLPEMNGIDLAIRIKAEYPQCRVTLISGDSGTFDLLSRAREQGHDLEVTAKPVHPSALFEMLAEPGELPS